VGEVVRLLESAPAATAEEGPPQGVDSWVRPFTVELVLCERSATVRDPAVGGGVWRTFVPPGHPLAAALPQLLRDLPSTGGVLVGLPPDPGEEHVPLLLEAAHAALACRRPAQFVLVQRGAGAASLARTLQLEATDLGVCVIDVPDHPRASEWIAAEARAVKGYREAHYDEAGRRYEPVLRLLDQNGDQVPLDLGGVLLVTGGGKGITAECALALARSTGTKLAVFGRSDPAADRALAANLERMRAAGLTVRYIAVDIAGATAGAAVHEMEESLGPVTAILHGAGVNTPRLLATLDESAFRATLAPKLQGLRNLLNAVDPQRLRLLVAFGSVIARAGMPGEADYAVANEWLARAVDRWRADHPHCRCLTIEWSIWSGLGMGERLGRVDALMRQGITPIPPDEGVRVFQDLVSRELPGTSVIVTSRFGDSPALRLEDPGLPFARFLERPRVYYPRVELIADAELSTDSDPYLRDHVFQGTPLLPAVMGLEAMAQAAAALSGSSETPLFEDVHFSRPVNIPEGATVTVRIAALARSDGAIELALRSSETAFQVDHFRAVCRRPSPQVPAAASSGLISNPDLIAPASDLYGSLLFQNGRFRRLRGYRRLHATECIAEIAPPVTGDWFARYLPSTLWLGDPGARDALIHSVQACIPHCTILPTGVERIAFGRATAPGPRFVHARERSANGPLFVYDLDVTDAAGELVERWEGLQLRVVNAAVPALPWAAALLGPYLERRVGEFVTNSELSIAVGQNADFPAGVRKRPDGKPEANGHHVSRSHVGDLGLVVASTRAIGCDVEPVLARSPAVWRDLLGAERFSLAELIARESGEDSHAAATRVWCAMESLKKAGGVDGRPILFSEARPEGWIHLTAGSASIATLVTAVRDTPGPVAFALSIE
jgi:enediyne polyketide synthase